MTVDLRCQTLDWSGNTIGTPSKFESEDMWWSIYRAVQPPRQSESSYQPMGHLPLSLLGSSEFRDRQCQYQCFWNWLTVRNRRLRNLYKNRIRKNDSTFSNQLILCKSLYQDWNLSRNLSGPSRPAQLVVLVMKSFTLYQMAISGL